MWLSPPKSLAVLITGSILSSAQTAVVKVRVLDLKTNRPVTHHRIGLLPSSVVGKKDWTHHIIKKRTGSDGTAVFVLSSHPSEMSVVENGMEVTVSTAEVLERG